MPLTVESTFQILGIVAFSLSIIILIGIIATGWIIFQKFRDVQEDFQEKLDVFTSITDTIQSKPFKIATATIPIVILLVKTLRTLSKQKS